MSLKPNYSFERRERERLQAVKAEEKARLKRENRRGKTADSAIESAVDPE